MDAVSDDGQPLYYGDIITLYSSHHHGFMRADGFNSTELVFRKMSHSAADIACQWKVTSKLNFQQQKILKKKLKRIGCDDIKDYTDELKEKARARLGWTDEEDAEILRRKPMAEKEKSVNQAEEKRVFGESVKYGEIIQLKHVKSGKFLSLTKITARQPGTMKAQVIDDGDEGSWFGVIPGFRVRKEGEEVLVTDQITLKCVKKSTPERPITLHINAESMGKCPGLEPEIESEIHGWEEPSNGEREREASKPVSERIAAKNEKPSKFLVHRYSRFDVGGESICSGSYVRLLHREEEAFLRYGDVTRPAKKGAHENAWKNHRIGHKLHLHSTVRDKFGVAKTSSNAVWEIIQTDQVSIEKLNETMRRLNANPDASRLFPKAGGGNITWEKLFRFKHVGTGMFLAASFASIPQPAPGAGNALADKTRQYIRFYLTPLDRQKDDGSRADIPSAHIESLFNIEPVNPADPKTEIKFDIPFHIQHAVSGHWISARSDENDVPEYYKQEPAEDKHITRKESPFRQVQLVGPKPYPDAFTFAKVRDDPDPDDVDGSEVRDINMILTVIPELQRFIDEHMNEMHPMGTTITHKITEILRKLIDEYITYTVAGQKEPHKGRRQQLMREQGLLDILVRITRADPYISKNLGEDGGFVPGGLNYFMMAGLPGHELPDALKEEGGNGLHPLPAFQKSSLLNLHSLCKMANRLMYFALMGNQSNCLYMIQYIIVYRDQIGAKLDSMEILKVLHENNRSLLEKLDEAGFEGWIQMVPTCLKAGKWEEIVDILHVPMAFLSYTCMCAGTPGAPGESVEDEPVRKNQDAIAKYLFRDQYNQRVFVDDEKRQFLIDDSPEILTPPKRIDDPRNPDAEHGVAVLSIQTKGMTMYVKDITCFPEPRLKTINEIFVDNTPASKEMQKYIVESLTLYANLCAGNRHNQNIIGRIMPKHVLESLITVDRKNCEELRAAACGLLFRLYIDADGNQPKASIERTRTFKEVVEENANMLVLRDDIPFPELKAWIVEYLSQNTKQLAAISRTLPNGQIELIEPNNKFVVAVLKLVRNLLKFGVYTELQQLEEVLKPILAILDSSTDLPDREKIEEQNRKWRYEDVGGNKVVILAKLEICRILGFVQEIALNYRIARTLLVFRDHLDSFKHRKAIKGTVNSLQLQRMIMSGSKLKKAKFGSWASVQKSMKETKSMFQTLDFSTPELRNLIEPSFGASFINDLFELTLYKHDGLVAEAYKVMSNQYCQRDRLGKALSQVQLLCSQDQVNFFRVSTSMKSEVNDFLKSDRGPRAVSKCTSQLEMAIEELNKAKSNEELQARQRLFANVAFPDIVVRILKLEPGSGGLEDEDLYPTYYHNFILTERHALFHTAYKFLYNCVRGNNDMKNTRVFSSNLFKFIEHLDIKPKYPPTVEGEEDYATLVKKGTTEKYDKVDVNAEQLVRELYQDNMKLVQAVTSNEIKNFVSLVVNNGRHPHLLSFLNMLAVVGDDDNCRPVKRNQQLIIKGLIQNKAKAMTPSLYKTDEEWQNCKALMADGEIEHQLVPHKPPPEGGLRYHAELIDLLFRCARGKNKAAEQLCQAEVPLEAISRGLRDPDTIPLVKRAYLNFMWESYIELERPKRATPTSEEIWSALEKLGTDLKRSQLTMISVDIQPGYRYTEECVRDEIQYLYRDGLTFLTKWFRDYYKPAEWIVPDDRKQKLKQRARDILDGVCVLLERPAIPGCQIGIRDTENGYKCVVSMMKTLNPVGEDGSDVQPSADKQAVATSFFNKGKALEESSDDFSGGSQGIPPQEKLIQLSFDMLAKDYCRVVDPEEELSLLGATFRSVITQEQKALVYGNQYCLDCGATLPAKPRSANKELNIKRCDHKNVDLAKPEKYVRAVVDHMTGNQLRVGSTMSVGEDVQKNLLTALKLVLYPPMRGSGKKAQKRHEMEIITLQELCCTKDADGSVGMMVPDMLCTLLQKLPAHEKVVSKEVLGLLRRLLYKGNEKVQDTLYEELSVKDFKRCEKVFDHLESRLLQSKVETKAGQTFHNLQAQQMKDAAAAEAGRNEVEKPDKAQIAIDAAMEPPRETFDEYGFVEDILQIMKDFCEDDHQPGKKFLAFQQGTDKTHNLAVATVQFTEAWQRSLNASNVTRGEFAFKALTEMVIGPCERTQMHVGSELKMDTVNELFAITLRPPWVELEHPLLATVDKIALRKVQTACVRCLQAMLEGQKSSRSRERCVKTLLDLKQKIIEDNIITIYQDYMDSRRPLDMIKAWANAGHKFDMGRLDLALQFLTLLRQLHDADQDEKRPKDFIQTLMNRAVMPDGWMVNMNQKPKLIIEDQKKRDLAETAFNFNYSKMARIEINRKPREGKSRIERVYFKRPPMCDKLTEETKSRLIEHVVRSSAEEKLKDFMQQSDEFLAEMVLQERLNKKAVYMFLDRRREFWATMSWYNVFIINLILIASVDHEDKFDDDPAADFDVKPGSEKLGTPINIMDIETLHIQRWVTMDLTQGKVAYIPQAAYEAITWLGMSLIVFSSIKWVLFIFGFGPIVARKGFKTRHVDEQRALKLDDANYDEIPFNESEYMKKRGPYHRWPLFWAKQFWYVISDGRCVGNMLYMAVVLSSFFVTEFFYCLLLGQILARDSELQSAMMAIIIPIVKIGKVLLLTIIFMYVFTIVGFSILHDQFNGGDNKEDNMCNSLLQCFSFTVYHGIIGSEMWYEMEMGDLWPEGRYVVGHDEEASNIAVFTLRIMNDIFFFLIVGVILIGGVLFGIILDQYTELREQQEERDDDQQNTCFICLQKRSLFDTEGNGWNSHYKDDHNMWNYIYFLVHLELTDKTEYNGPEAYVAGRLDPNKENPDTGQCGDPYDVDWFPKREAIALQKPEPGQSNIDAMTSKVGSMREEVDALTLKSKEMVKHLEECKVTAKLVKKFVDQQADGS